MTRTICVAGLASVFCALTSASVVAATLQEQIDHAARGATIVVRGGVHPGPLVIRQPLILVGENRPVIQGAGKGKVVHIAADHVTVRGFHIRGSGLALFDDDAAVFVTANRVTIEDNIIDDSLHGVYLKKADDCCILGNRITGKTTIQVEKGSIEAGIGVSPENCDPGTLVTNRRGNGIHLWNCERTTIRGNEISEARDGIYLSFANHTECDGNIVHHVRYGLHYMYSDDNVFTRNRFSENAAGAALMFSKRLTIRGNQFANNRGFRAYGLIFQSMDDCRLEANAIAHNAVGISFNQCNRNQVVGNHITANYIGLRFGSNSDENGFALNQFRRNLHPVEIAGENGSNHWSVAGVGNYWEGAAPLDLDGDHVNDLPHRELDLLGVLRRDFPTISLLSESPALKLLRLAHERAAL
ncbi:MAG TPA: NosD domain-containing protein, partial [Chthoniobacteraceae bacterium]|nr:NosD domain-containing protein [Chthoniobacteraceae bacterium]